MQVRRGDACGQTRPCLDMDLYIEASMEMVNKYGIRTIYIASDDEEAVREVCMLHAFLRTNSRNWNTE